MDNYFREVIEHTILNIRTNFNFKTEEDAKEALAEALAKNVVQCEILEMISHLQEKKKFN